MSWILLVVAGLLEVAWASLLPRTNGLTQAGPTIGFLVLLGLSMFALARASQTIPLGTAYAVWVGIGAIGAAVVGIAYHGDPASPARVAFMCLLVVAICGLKVTSGH